MFFIIQQKRTAPLGVDAAGSPFCVDFTAALRYEPCTQFINVSQRTLHIYFIDGCQVCPLDAQYKVKNKNSDL